MRGGSGGEPVFPPFTQVGYRVPAKPAVVRSLYRALCWALYVIAGCLLFRSATELALSIIPYVTEDLGRRYGALPALGRGMTAHVLGWIFAMFAAGVLAHRNVLRILTDAAFLTAGIFVAVSMVVAMQISTARAQLPLAETLSFDVLVVAELGRCLLLSLLIVVVCFLGRSSSGDGILDPPDGVRDELAISQLAASGEPLSSQ